MKVLALTIEGFRGIKKGRVVFGDHTALIGPNSTGKTTIVDALALVFGRTQLVRDLTEHDFFGSCPEANTRMRIIATLGFGADEPERHPAWFRDDRAIPKWWNKSTKKIEPQPSADAGELCAEIAFCARFDLEELEVESRRYFYDHDDEHDPFDEEDAVTLVQQSVLNEIGFYILPVRRTWEATASFASDLFRKAVTAIGGIPAETLLEERDRLREPAKPLEEEARLKPLVARINEQLGQLMPQAPQFQLRLTSTDSEALLRALVPHYLEGDDTSLPAGRHGTGLLSLQIFILLIEIGRSRKEKGLSFILAMEEPELHVAPGLQRRLLAQAVSIAGQTMCSTHSPRVGSFYPATAVRFVDRVDGELKATALLAQPLPGSATQATRKLFHDDRARVVEALMHHRVLVPEGRGDCEWLRLLADVVETGDAAFGKAPKETAPFGAVVGVVPTTDSKVTETYEHLRPLRSGFLALVDGDDEGDDKVQQLVGRADPPERVLQWADDWEIEDVIKWVLDADAETAVRALQPRLPAYAFTSTQELLALMKVKSGTPRFKTDYLAYEEVASIVQEIEACRDRAAEVLDAITAAALGKASARLQADTPRSTGLCQVVRFVP